MDMNEMTRESAIVELSLTIAALYPYADPKDDPDRNRAAGQRRARAALDVVRGAFEKLERLETVP